MEQVIKYKAKDGGIFNSSTECQEHELLCYQVQQAMAPLGDCPEAVANGKGWLQHSPQTVIACRQAIMDICVARGMAKTFHVFNLPAKDVHPMSMIGRILDDYGGPLGHAWYRVRRIDEKGREHQQPYYALNGPDKEQICVEDRLA